MSVYVAELILKFEIMHTSTVKLGKLVQILPSGKELVLYSNKPWGVLQQLKAEHVQRGIKKENLKLKYM